MKAKPFFVLLFFLLLIILFAGASIGDADLTGRTNRVPSSGPSGQNNVVAGASASRCGSTYTVQSGDTLSRIAQSCGVTLLDVLAMNPAITNANFIRVGQKIALPVPPAPTLTQTLMPTLTQTSTSTATPRPGLQPGDPVSVDIIGFPTKAGIEIGVGKVGFYATPIGQETTDENGVLHITMEVPKKAKANEQWTVFITTLGQPKIKVTAVPFVIGK